MEDFCLKAKLKEFTFLLLLGFKARERWAEEAELGCNWFVLVITDKTKLIHILI